MNAVSLRDTGSPLLRSSLLFSLRMEEEGGQGQGEGPPSPFLSRSVGEEGGWGEGEGRPHPPATSGGLREGWYDDAPTNDQSTTAQ